MLLLLALFACDDHLLGVHGSDLPCDREPPLTWENFGEGHLAKHCTGCHSTYLETPDARENAPLGVDFDTWQGTLDWADRIWERTVVIGGMPPGGGPDAQEQLLFEEWMDCEVLPAAGLSGGAR